MSKQELMQTLLEQSEQFGAVFRNVRVEGFDNGFGLVAVNANADIEISVPKEMQLSRDAVDMTTGKLKAEADVPAEYRDWVDRYLSVLLNKDRMEAEAAKREFVAAMDEETQETFSGMALGNFLNPATDVETTNQFLLGNQFIGSSAGPVLNPILGLARPGQSALTMQVSANGSFRVVGKAEEEINVVAGPYDALHALNSMNHAARFNAAFSVPMAVQLAKGGTLRIGRAFHDKQRVQNMSLPRVSRQGEIISLAYIPIGFANQPRAPREIFRQTLKPFDLAGLDELWSRIRSYNLSKLFKAYVRAQALEHAGLKADLSETLTSQIETVLESI